MRKPLLLLALLLLAAPAYAQNLTVVVSVNGSTQFINSRDNLTVFNITVIPQNSIANITGINITINSAASGNVSGNISKVHVLNGSISGLLLGTNSSINPNLSSGSQIFVNFSTPLIMGAGTRTGLFVVFELGRSTRGITVGGNLTGTGDIVSNLTVVANVSLPNFTVATTRDLHYNASISPRIVDTSVDNQTFIYTLTPTGTDNASTVLVNIPSGFTNLSIIDITRGPAAANLTSGVTNTFTASLLNVTFATASNERVEVYFKANTSAAPLSSAAFASSLYGGNLDNVSTDVVLVNRTNVTATNIINRTTLAVSKGVAIVNGSDYWEFNFTLNFTVSTTGTLHFKMTNWTDEKNNTITLSSCSPSCATLRSDINASLNTSKINVTNAFDPNFGINAAPAAGNLTTLYFRMVIPVGAAISSTWFATYTLLFRATP